MFCSRSFKNVSPPSFLLAGTTVPAQFLYSQPSAKGILVEVSVGRTDPRRSLGAICVPEEARCLLS